MCLIGKIYLFLIYVRSRTLSEATSLHCTYLIVHVCSRAVSIHMFCTAGSIALAESHLGLLGSIARSAERLRECEL